MCRYICKRERGGERENKKGRKGETERVRMREREREREREIG